jgi:hypothetical protein
LAPVFWRACWIALAQPCKQTRGIENMSGAVTAYSWSHRNRLEILAPWTYPAQNHH